jgi:hypothetical protein
MERQEIPHDRLESFIGRRVYAEKSGAVMCGELLGPLDDQNDPGRRDVWWMRSDDGTETQILVSEYTFYAP